MDLGTLNIQIQAETTKLHNSVKNAQDILAGLGKVTKDGSEEMEKAFADASKKMDMEMLRMRNGIEQNQESIQKLCQYYEQLQIAKANALKAGNTKQADDLTAEIARIDLLIAQREGLVQEAQNNVEKLGKAFKKATSIEPKVGTWGELKNIFASMNGPLGQTFNDLQKVGQALKVILASPIGWVLTAISLALEALNKYLTGTSEGQEKLARATGYVDGVMTVFNDIVKSVGEAVYKLYEQLQQDFFGTLKKSATDFFDNFIVKRFNGMVDMFKNLGLAIGKVFEGEWEQAGELFSDAGSAYVQMMTGNSTEELVNGVKELGNQVEQFIGKADKTGKAMAQIYAEERQLQIARDKWQAESAKIQEQIAVRQQQMYTGTAKTRAKAGREMIALMQEQYGKEVEFAEKELQLQRRKMALSKNADEDYQKEAQLLANVVQKRAQMQQSIAGVYRRLHSAEKEALYTDRQLEIDAMKEGFNKEQAQRDLERQKAIDAIEYDKEEYVRAVLQANKEKAEAEGKQFNETDARKEIDTTDYDEYIKSTNKKFDVEDAQALDKSLGRYRDYNEQRLDIARKYDELIAQSRTDNEKEQLTKAKEQKIDQLDMSTIEGEGNEMFEAWKQQISQLGLTQLSRKLQEAKNKLQQLVASGRATTTEIAQTRGQIAVIEREIQSGKFELPGTVEGAWKDLRGSVNKASQTVRGFGGELADTIGQIFDTAQTITDVVFESINNINKLVEISTGAMATTATTAATAIKAVEMASVILAIIGAIMQAVQAVIALISRESEATKQYAQEKAFITQITEVWNQALEAKRAYYDEGGHSTEELQKNFAEEQKIIEKQVNAYRDLAKKRLEAGGSIGSHSYGFRMWEGSYEFEDGKNWKDISKEIERERNVQFKNMSDLVNMSSEDLRWIRETYASAWASMDSDFRDHLNTIIEGEDKLKESAESYQHALLGTTWSDFRNDAISSLTDVEATAEGVAKNIGDSIRQSMITNMFNKEFDARLKQFYEKWQMKAESDGVLSESERAELEAEYQAIADEATARAKQINEMFGAQDDDITTMSGAIASASQESIDLLAGQTNAVRINQVDGLDVMREQLAELTAIHQLTATMAGFMEKINNRMATNNNNDSLRSSGITSF